MQNYEDLNDRLKRLNLDITFNDFDAWEKYPEYKKIYNKLWLVEQQKIACGPIGTTPKSYPIIIKPIINLYGMSRGFKKINNKDEYFSNQADGCFWMPFLDGINYTVDLILSKGKVIQQFFMESFPSVDGTFLYHHYLPKMKLSKKLVNFIEINFKNYSGPMNIEVINNVIIEGHLRLNGDCYIYDDDFFLNLDRLINNKKFKFNVCSNEFFLFPYFVTNKFNSSIMNRKEIEDILIENDVNNIRWDNINSFYQRKDLLRLLMFKVDSVKKGNKIINLIKRNLYLRYKLFNYEKQNF